MGRRAQTEERWRSTSSPYGYVEPRPKRPLKGRKRIAVMRHNSRRRSTGLLWSKENKEQCLAMLQAWMDGTLAKQPEEKFEDKSVVKPLESAVDSQETTEQMTLQEMIDRWKNLTRWQNMTTRRQYIYDRAFAIYFPNNVPAERSFIREMIQGQEAALHKAGGSPNTRRMMLKTIKTFLSDCVAEDWLDKNPMLGMQYPKAKKSEDEVVIYSWEETQRVIDKAYTLPTYRQQKSNVNRELLPLAFNLARRMGARISEQMNNLYWEDIHPEKIVLHRKGPKVVELEWKFFPFCPEIIEEVRQILNRYGYPTEGHAPVFGPLTEGTIRLRWNTLCEDAGVDRGRSKYTTGQKERTWHTLRKTATWLMDEIYCYDEGLMTDLCGNTVEVRKKHYRAQRSAADLDRRHKRSETRRKEKASPRRKP